MGFSLNARVVRFDTLTEISLHIMRTCNPITASYATLRGYKNMLEVKAFKASKLLLLVPFNSLTDTTSAK